MSRWKWFVLSLGIFAVCIAANNWLDETTWPQQFAWLQSNLETFDQAFRPLVADKPSAVSDALNATR